MYTVRMDKYRATWNYFTTNPQGGGFGSNYCGPKYIALAKGDLFSSCGNRVPLDLQWERFWHSEESAMKLEYIVVVTDELGAGIRGFTDEVSVEIKDSASDWETIQLATAHFRTAISEWYDMGKVWTKEEYDREQAASDSRPDEGDLLASDEWDKQS